MLLQVSDHGEGWGHVNKEWGWGRAGYQQHIMRVIRINSGSFRLENHQKAASRRITHLLRERDKRDTYKWNGEDETVHQRCVQSFGRVRVAGAPSPTPPWGFFSGMSLHLLKFYPIVMAPLTSYDLFQLAVLNTLPFLYFSTLFLLIPFISFTVLIRLLCCSCKFSHLNFNLLGSREYGLFISVFLAPNHLVYKNHPRCLWG